MVSLLLQEMKKNTPPQTHTRIWLTLCQWRRKGLRGPGSTVTWGPPFPLPFLIEVGLPIVARGSGGALKRSPSGSGRSAAAKRFLVHFQPIWRHFLQTFSCSLSFVKLLFHVASDVKYHIVLISKSGHCIIFLWLGARGPQELGGPGSLNRLNPRYLRHCALWPIVVYSEFYSPCAFVL